jgi:hypothetical protein
MSAIEQLFVSQAALSPSAEKGGPIYANSRCDFDRYGYSVVGNRRLVTSYILARVQDKGRPWAALVLSQAPVLRNQKRKVIRAWKDEEYRSSLSEAQRSMVLVPDRRVLVVLHVGLSSRVHRTNCLPQHLIGGCVG